VPRLTNSKRFHYCSDDDNSIPEILLSRLREYLVISDEIRQWFFKERDNNLDQIF
jgi:hypothetical protein